MLNSSLWQMILGRLREFQREPSAMVFVLTMPLVWMMLLGFVFSDPKPQTYGVGVHMSVPSEVKIALQKTPYLDVRVSEQLEDFRNPIRRGELQVVVSLLADGRYRYQYDPGHPKGLEARRALDEIVQRSLGRADAVSFYDEPKQETGGRYIDFLIPGLLALSLFTTSLFGTGMTIVASRRENILKRYRATPMSPILYFISHILGRYVISFIEFSVIMIAGWLFFGFQVSGSWCLFALLCVLGTAAFTALSILCGARTANSAAYAGMNNLVTLPMMILSGVWFSRHSFPEWLSFICDLLPLTPLVDGLRRVALEGADMAAVQSEMLILVVYTVGATALTKKIFRWY
ncbi:MAG: ABC transporter permease [Oligoflexales bacterium]